MKPCLLISNLILLALLASQALASVPVTLYDNDDERNPVSINDNFTETNRRITDVDLTAGGTVSGNLTVTGSLTLSGSLVVGATTFSNGVASSSTLNGFSGSTSGSVCTTCVSGSTLTITVSGGSRLLVSLVSTIYNANTAFPTVCLIFNHEYFKAQPMTAGYTTSNTPANMSFSAMTETLSAGDYPACVGYATNAGTVVWDYNGKSFLSLLEIKEK